MTEKLYSVLKIIMDKSWCISDRTLSLNKYRKAASGENYWLCASAILFNANPLMVGISIASISDLAKRLDQLFGEAKGRK